MQSIDGTLSLNIITPEILKETSGSTITGFACVHKIHKGSGFTFVDLRTGRYILQGVYISELCKASLNDAPEGTYIKFLGTVKEEPRTELGYEITLQNFSPLSAPSEDFPLNISDKVMNCTLEANLEHRHLALRHPHQRAIIKISEGVSNAFEDFMKSNQFTRLHTSDIAADAKQKDSRLFKLKYFDNDAVLTNNSVYARQAAVAAFERVYEITHAFRADKHNSTRHLSEYMRLDFEMAFVTDISELMQVQTALLKHIATYLAKEYLHELKLLDVKLPSITSIPVISFSDAIKMLGKDTSQSALDPTDEARLCEYAKTSFDSDFIFVTHLPSEKQPFYIMDCRNNAAFSETFVLIYKGREITYGNRKIHDYTGQLNKLLSYTDTLDENWDSYLNLHRHALPPHGGAGTGLERLVAGLLNLENIKEASLFPRDMHHLNF